MNWVSWLLRYRKEVLIVAVAILFRVALFGSVPPGLNQDEASIGYESYCLYRYGVDRNGYSYPVHFVSWGSGQNALYAYLAMPIVAAAGLNVVTTRLPSLILSSVGIIFLYLLALRLVGKDDGWVALLVISVLPWHFTVSRWGLESNLFPTLFLIGVYLFIVGCDRPKCLAGSFLIFGFAMYSYGPSYLVVPVFLSLAIVCVTFQGRLAPRTWLVPGVIFVCSSLPMFYFIVIQLTGYPELRSSAFSIPRLPQARFSETSAFFSSDFLGCLIQNYKEFVSLFLFQNDQLSWNTLPYFGFMYPISLVLLPLGVIQLAKFFRTSLDAKVVVIWTLCGLLLAGCVEINLNRINLWLYLVALLASLGIARVKHYGRIAHRVIVAIYIASFALFLGYYFGEGRAILHKSFYAGLGEAIRRADDLTNGAILLDLPTVRMPYIFVLFYLRIDPGEFRRTRVLEGSDSAFQQIVEFGRFKFDERFLDVSQVVVVESGRNIGGGQFTKMCTEGNYDVLLRITHPTAKGRPFTAPPFVTTDWNTKKALY